MDTTSRIAELREISERLEALVQNGAAVLADAPGVQTQAAAMLRVIHNVHVLAQVAWALNREMTRGSISSPAPAVTHYLVGAIQRAAFSATEFTDTFGSDLANAGDDVAEITYVLDQYEDHLTGMRAAEAHLRQAMALAAPVAA